MEKKTRNKKVILVAVAIFVAVGIAAGVLYACFMPKTMGTGAKQIVVEVVHADKSIKQFTIKTNAEYLRGPLEEQKLALGEESSYGLFVKTVDGETADDSKQQWWCVTKGGQPVTNGVDTQPIADGEKYELTLTEGY